FEPSREILISRSSRETLRYLREIPEAERRAIGQRARDRVLAAHTAAHRAAELERYAREALGRSPQPTLAGAGAVVSRPA
ncbi:MAG TPA: glycosyltransferase, partial [Armatimonadota bacterium]|nr:glycosyltransferase [Armatimonadota bacterium]